MTPEQVDAILEDVACGLSDVKAAESRGIDRKTFYRRMLADEELRHRYARAKDAGLEVWSDEINSIPDAADQDAAAVAKARLQVDSRKWLLSKLAPKKYGDRLDVEHGGNINVTVKRFSTKDSDGDA